MRPRSRCPWRNREHCNRRCPVPICSHGPRRINRARSGSHQTRHSGHFVDVVSVRDRRTETVINRCGETILVAACASTDQIADRVGSNAARLEWRTVWPRIPVLALKATASLRSLVRIVDAARHVRRNLEGLRGAGSRTTNVRNL